VRAAQSARPLRAKPTAIEDLVLASRILANEGVLDAYGHVSVRHPTDPNRYLMARSGTGADHGGRYSRIRSQSKPVKPTEQRLSPSGSSTARSIRRGLT